MIKQHGRFQLESTKLGRSVVFQVTVFEKVDRRRTRLFAETQCSDPYQFIIQFVIKDAESMEDIIQRFVEQLEHRGFRPDRYRLFTERWSAWVNLASDSAGAA